MTPIHVLRPEPGCAATVRAAQAMGLEAHGFPLFDVRPLAWQAPPSGSFDALLIGSANVLRHGGSALADFSGKPAYCVGETTARAAREAGLDVIATGEGGLQQLLPHIAPRHRRLLRLAGRERVELALPAGMQMDECVVYASEPVALPPELAGRLASGGIVLLHSREAAQHFAAECDRLGLHRSGLAIAALGPRIAEAAGEGWAAVASAPVPSDQALLALAGQMCQNHPGSTV